MLIDIFEKQQAEFVIRASCHLSTGRGKALRGSLIFHLAVLAAIISPCLRQAGPSGFMISFRFVFYNNVTPSGFIDFSSGGIGSNNITPSGFMQSF